MFRGGISGDKFVAVIPALTVGIIFNDYIKVNMVGGVRGGMPAIGFNLFFNMPFKNSKQRSHENRI